MIRAVKSSKEELWRSRLERFQGSGLSVKAFCRLERVSEPSFYQWRKRLAAEEPGKDGPRFLPVRLAVATAIEIHLPNGARVCVPADQAEALRLAIEAAGRLDDVPSREADGC